jgi:cyclopropane fatty-acyl-phospholipid synthase-like methyltransferase
MSPATRHEYEAANDAFYASFWSKGSGYDSRWPNAEEAARAGAILAFVSRIAEQEQMPLTLLDVGCGRGWLTNLLALYGPATGCDLADGGLQLGRQLFPHLSFQHGAVAELLDQRRIAPVRVLVSSEVLEHVPVAYKTEFVASLRRAIVPKGHCVISTPRQEMYAAAGESSAQVIEEWSTESAVARLFTEQGFVRREFTRAYPAGGTRADRFADRAERWLSIPLPMALRVWLDWRSALYQVWWFQRVD